MEQAIVFVKEMKEDCEKHLNLCREKYSAKGSNDLLEVYRSAEKMAKYWRDLYKALRNE